MVFALYALSFYQKYTMLYICVQCIKFNYIVYHRYRLDTTHISYSQKLYIHLNSYSLKIKFTIKFYSSIISFCKCVWIYLCVCIIYCIFVYIYMCVNTICICGNSIYKISKFWYGYFVNNFYSFNIKDILQIYQFHLWLA